MRDNSRTHTCGMCPFVIEHKINFNGTVECRCKLDSKIRTVNRDDCPYELQPITRCEKCKYFVSIERLNYEDSDNEYYDPALYSFGKEIGAAGMCVNINKWMEPNSFCSDASPIQKEETNE